MPDKPEYQPPDYSQGIAKRGEECCGKIVNGAGPCVAPKDHTGGCYRLTLASEM